MRHKNPELMEHIREYIDNFYLENHRMPATSEIGSQFSIVKSTAYKYLCAMHDAGMLCYENGVISTELSGKANIKMVLAPIYNESISCDPTEGFEASIRDYVSLPAAIFGNGDLYGIRTCGNSMVNLGIEPEDLVIVQKGKNVKPGNIVAVKNENGIMLNMLDYDANSQAYYLYTKNPDSEKVYTDKSDVFGVASFIIKKLNTAEGEPT